ncbi:hypothetical protein [Achromobacter sp. UMC71]|uniref:phage baseplate plug family protein n=1 Tax=Achromobacter sp. UMC71 TaxID=1862320 RepID=UPI001601E750|nr:hypothetical protein [Achromobacter sp. UMC71]MBB1625689.1 hypothetical protein [Achromobacter sp. UMC71]
MASFYEIPLLPVPQSFTIALGGKDYRLTMQYRDGWMLDIGAADGGMLVAGIPLVTGVDLLGQYRHLGFEGGLWLINAISSDDPPTYENLGIESKLYWKAG